MCYNNKVKKKELDMKKENLNEYVKKISEILDDKIKIITSIKYYYDLEELTSSLNNLSNEEVENVLEQLINVKLEEIQKSSKVDKFRENNRLVDDVTEFFYDNKEENGAIFEEGSCIASDLILKVIGINGRKIKLPVKISYVKEYCISNLVEEKNIRKTLLWIFLELSVVSYFLNN